MTMSSPVSLAREKSILPFKLASIEPNGPEPLWDGQTFHVGTKSVRILNYGSTEIGWTDELTALHEEAAGQDHFIDVASREHALQQVQRFVRQSGSTILEVGCSSGYLLEALTKLNRDGITMAADIVRDPLEQVARRIPNIPLFRFDLLECPLPSSSVDAVVALNVLEHIEDDFQALKQIHRVLKPGGIAVLEVPAGPELFDNYDRVLMHFRRYDMRGLQELVGEAGLRVEYSSHLGCFIYPPFWIVKFLSKLKTPQSATPNSEQVEKDIKTTGENKLLELATKLELALGTKLTFPFGIRCLLTCSK